LWTTLITIFSQQLLTLIPITIMLTHTTHIIPILTIIIVPYNLGHKSISQETLKLSDSPQQWIKLNKVIRSLKSNDSHGYDKISTKLLKISSTFISSPLTYIRNEVLITGIFPDRLKLSTIKPLYKKTIKRTYLTTDQSLS
jgi:hypothetical protein